MEATSIRRAASFFFFLYFITFTFSLSSVFPDFLSFSVSMLSSCLLFICIATSFSIIFFISSGIFGNVSFISSNLIMLPPFLNFSCILHLTCYPIQLAMRLSFNTARAFSSLFFTALSVTSSICATSFTL